jgi:DNA-binding LytR/AlgR family response regulator
MSARLLIADDEALMRQVLREALARLWPKAQLVAEAANGVEALALAQREQPGICFLDIKMPGLTGIEVAQRLSAQPQAPRIVFVTAYDQFALQAFDQAAVDYVLKPFSDERLAKTIARLQASQTQPDLSAVLAQLQAQLKPAAPQNHLRWVRASRGEITYQIAVDEVLLFQADDKYTVVNTRDGEFLIRLSLAELLASLDPEAFWQVHRSYLVNARAVQSSRRDEAGHVFLRLRGYSKEVPVSRAYQGLFRQM